MWTVTSRGDRDGRGPGWRREPLRQPPLEPPAPDPHFADDMPSDLRRSPIHGDHLFIVPGRGHRPLYRVRLLLNQFALRYPARLTLSVFALLITLITSLLLLPAANVEGQPTPFITAFFTSVSSVCVTGLTVVDTATYWTLLGQIIIAVAITLGGLGVMTMASLLTLVVSRRLGLTQRLLSQSDTQGRMGDALTLIKGVLITTFVAEIILFAVVAPSFLNHGHSAWESIWDALFMSISAFNNAGFVVMPEGLEAYVGSWGVLLPLTISAFVGAIGFPVIVDLRRHWRTPRALTLHSKMTISAYVVIAAVSGLMIAALEWNNPYTYGQLDLSEKVLNTLVNTVNTRSLGASAIDVSQMTGATWLVQDISMFIGGGSASHAGGIKVTTFLLLLLAAWAETRGRRDVEAFHRRIPLGTVRQAVAVLLAAAILVLGTTGILLVITPFTMDRIVFEVISAFGTVGLSTGITSALPPAAKLLLAALMIIGRVGPMTFAAALALRERKAFIRLPEERPIVG